MPLDTLIADTRQAISDDAANAQAVFAAHSTLVGVTEDEHCPVLDLFKNPVPVSRALVTSG